MQPLDIIPILTLFIILFHGHGTWYMVHGTWYVQFSTMFLAIIALLYRELLRNPTYWFIFACIINYSILTYWQPVDDQKFLLNYVTIMLFCAFTASSGAQLKIITGNALSLIITLMGMSVFWKLYSSDTYLDGTFFEYTYITDPRFDAFLASCGLDLQQLANNQQAISNLKQAYLEQDITSAQVYTLPY